MDDNEYNNYDEIGSYNVFLPFLHINIFNQHTDYIAEPKKIPNNPINHVSFTWPDSGVSPVSVTIDDQRVFKAYPLLRLTIRIVLHFFTTL